MVGGGFVCLEMEMEGAVGGLRGLGRWELDDVERLRKSEAE